MIDRTVAYTIAIDPKFSGRTADRFGGAVVSTQLQRDPIDDNAPGTRITRVHETFAWLADRSPKLMADRLRREVLDRYGHSGKVYTDQYEGFSFKELAASAGVKLEVVPWTGGDREGSKQARFRAVRTAMLEGALRIPNDAELLRELRSVRGVLLPSGSERIEVPRSAQGHGDRVSALVLAVSIALERRPKLAPSQWSYVEYQLRKREFFAACNAAGAMFFHAVFNNAEHGGCLAFTDLRRLVAAGEIKI